MGVGQIGGYGANVPLVVEQDLNLGIDYVLHQLPQDLVQPVLENRIPMKCVRNRNALVNRNCSIE